MEIIQVEYDSLLPANIKRETSAWINKRMDAQQEIQEISAVEQQTVSHKMVEMQLGSRVTEKSGRAKVKDKL